MSLSREALELLRGFPGEVGDRRDRYLGLTSRRLSVKHGEVVIGADVECGIGELTELEAAQLAHELTGAWLWRAELQKRAEDEAREELHAGSHG